MVFYILISVVFIAELVITCSVISHLLKWDKIILETDSFISELKPKIRDICQIGYKISEQLTELAPVLVDNTKEFVLKLAVNNLKNIITSFGIWAIRRYLKRY